MKKCSMCGGMKPREEFSKRPRSSDGLAPWCRLCVSAYNKRYRAKNRERLAEYEATRYQRDKPKRKVIMARHYRQNSEKYRRRAKESYENNKERQRERNRRAQAENPERWRQYQRRWKRKNRSAVLAAQRKRRAQKAGAGGRGITARDWRRIKREALGLCQYCNEKRDLTLDHVVPISLGGDHDPSNAVAACLSCNASKSDRPLVVWLAWRVAA